MDCLNGYLTQHPALLQKQTGRLPRQPGLRLFQHGIQVLDADWFQQVVQRVDLIALEDKILNPRDKNHHCFVTLGAQALYQRDATLAGQLNINQ